MSNNEDKEKQPMRILLLNQYYRPDTAATGQLLADLAEHLVRNGHDVHVICSRSSYSGGKIDRPSEEVVDGVQVHRISATGFGRGGVAGRITDYASFYGLAVLKALRLPKVDVCISLTTPPYIGLTGALLSRLRGTRLVLWTMDLYPEVTAAFGVLKEKSLLYRVLARLSRSLYANATAIVSLGEVMSQKLMASGATRDRIITVHNWVPGESVEPRDPSVCSKRRDWNLDGKVVLMYSGNLGLGHELDTALRAVRQLEAYQDLWLVFAGEGKMKAPLRQLAQELHVQRVKFVPPQPLEDLAQTLAVGDIHLVSQKPGTEGLIIPSKLYGVLAAGRPVIFIGPKTCEAATIVRASRAGVIVSPGSVQETADALRHLADDAELRRRMGAFGRIFYERNFGRDRSVRRITSVVENLQDVPAEPVHAESVLQSQRENLK